MAFVSADSGEARFVCEYRIEVSSDGENWTEVATVISELSSDNSRKAVKWIIKLLEKSKGSSEVFSAAERGFDGMSDKGALKEMRSEIRKSKDWHTRAMLINVARKRGKPDDHEALIKAITDKNAIVAGPEMSGFESPRAQLFSRNSPYCDVLLTPAMDYDLAAAKELNCPTDSGSTSTTPTITTTTKKKSKKEDMNGFKYGILFMVLFVIALLSGLAFIVMKEKEGEPIFMDITTKTPLTPTSKVENA